MAGRPETTGEAPVRLSARHFRPGTRRAAARRRPVAISPKGSRRRKVGAT